MLKIKEVSNINHSHVSWFILKEEKQSFDIVNFFGSTVLTASNRLITWKNINAFYFPSCSIKSYVEA